MSCPNCNCAACQIERFDAIAAIVRREKISAPCTWRATSNYARLSAYAFSPSFIGRNIQREAQDIMRGE